MGDGLLLLRLAQAILHPLPLADVPGDAHDAHHLAVGIEEGGIAAKRPLA